MASAAIRSLHMLLHSVKQRDFLFQRAGQRPDFLRDCLCVDDGGPFGKLPLCFCILWEMYRDINWNDLPSCCLRTHLKHMQINELVFLTMKSGGGAIQGRGCRPAEDPAYFGRYRREKGGKPQVSMSDPVHTNQGKGIDKHIESRYHETI